MKVLICGAGLGGLALAQSLRKQGIEYEIFERDVSPDARFQGWAISIHTIIDQLKAAFPDDVPDLEEAVNHLKPLTLPAQVSWYFSDLEDRYGVERTDQQVLIRAERHRLRDWLLTNINVQWNKRVTRIVTDDDGVAIGFEDGTSAVGDIVIGADGVNSLVRKHVLKKEASDLLKLVPLAAIVGEVDLSGDEFKRQLALAQGFYMFSDPTLNFFNFAGIHYVHPDGKSARHYWMLMRPDADVAKPDHWLQGATQEQKRAYVVDAVQALPPKFREIFELTPASGIRDHPHIWRDLELEHIPASRAILLGDAAHAMTPFRGEGGFHTLIDAMKLGKVLGEINVDDQQSFEATISAFNAEMLVRGVAAVRNSRNVHVGGGGTSDPKKMSPYARPMPFSDPETILDGQPSQDVVEENREVKELSIKATTEKNTTEPILPGVTHVSPVGA